MEITRMSNVRETLNVRCPFHEIIHHAERYFSVHRRGQSPGMFNLNVDMSRVGLPGNVQARHDVHVRYKVSKAEGKPDTILLTWDPDDRFVPTFNGTIAGARLERGETALTLEGEYDAPFGVAGAVFDAVLGRRIASVTAKSLLQDMKEFIEPDYQMALATTLASSPKE
jgi:hypothetical protein